MEPLPSPERPREIRLATYTLLASLGLDLLMGGLATGERYGQAPVGQILIELVPGFMFIALMGALIYFIADGSNWARITFGVLFFLPLLLRLGLIQDVVFRHGILGLLPMFEILLQGMALYWLFSRRGAVWFRA